MIDSSGLIRGLGLGPELVVPPLRDWAELDTALDIPGVTSTALVARLVDDRWVDLYERSADWLGLQALPPARARPVDRSRDGTVGRGTHPAPAAA
ncbi:hypothetical protein [Saccharomonospora sp.]|uniref:hypothetical protein n=1 Tax=Saccharomonospora sp. TaxID=33913 RepID=UPI0026235A16|nr:hypothetical protein [Saccharomonospora sp.]